MTAGPWVRGILSALVTVVAVAAVGLGVLAWDRFAGNDPDPGRPAVQSRDALACMTAQPTLFAALSGHLARNGNEFASRQFVVADRRGQVQQPAAPRPVSRTRARSTEPTRPAPPRPV